MKMMGFLLFFAFAHEIEELVACLSLVKWKIDNDEGSFDTILASTALEHEKVIDKVIGNMLETCANQITKEIIQTISSGSADLQKFEGLLDFEVKVFKDESELVLNEAQMNIIEKLENYVSPIKNPNFYHWYLILSFSAVVVFVVVKRIPSLLNTKKNI